MVTQKTKDLLVQIRHSVQVRLDAELVDPSGACRLFNGFTESDSDLVIEQFADTLVILDHSDQETNFDFPEIQETILKTIPSTRCVLVKKRRSTDSEARNGKLTFGEKPAGEIQENGVRYAINLRLNQDSSFYMDTRHLRSWLKHRSAGWKVLNCFAYTGSLGAASLAGGATRVCQLDLSRKFLSLARKTYSLNDFKVDDADFLIGDFFRITASLRREATQFDCVILDAPFFSMTTRSRLETQKDSIRLINKVRPLVRDGGRLVAVNNSLFLSGEEYLRSLNALELDDCLEIEEIIPIPPDVTGFPRTIIRRPPADTAPFNYPTKIAILKVSKRDQ
jgi:23S rRNA (cytosine1962-C5)-methyltransferase